MIVAIPQTLAKGPLSGPNAMAIDVSFTEDAVSTWGNGVPRGTWSDTYPSTGVPTIELIKTGKAYHRADGMWFNIWLDQMSITGNSPMTISNGRLACWTEYFSPFSGLLIRDQFRGQITIFETDEGWTMEGEYTQYSYSFGTADEILSEYPNAIQIDNSDKWLIGTTIYTAHP